MFPVEDKLAHYKQDFLDHVRRMTNIRHRNNFFVRRNTYTTINTSKP
jgi:hypothetical protein